MNITRITEFLSAPEKEDECYSFLKSLVPYILSCDGCTSCEVLRNTEQRNSVIVIEKWDSIDAHKKSVAGFPKEDMQSAMMLFGAPPKGNYYSQ